MVSESELGLLTPRFLIILEPRTKWLGEDCPIVLVLVLAFGLVITVVMRPKTRET